MISNTSPSLSALVASSTKLNETAHNIANSNTKGYQASHTLIEENADNQGVQARTIRDSSNISNEAQSQIPSNVDYGTEMVESISAVHMYTANLETIKAEDNLVETTLDLMA